jgi:hypothetical protein
MMMAADLTLEAHALLWAEALNTANDLENITLNTMSDKSPDKLFTNEPTKLMDCLKNWICNNTTKSSRKMEREEFASCYGGLRKESFGRHLSVVQSAKQKYH